MNASIFDREAGGLSPYAFNNYVTGTLLHNFAAAPHHRFDGERSSSASSQHRPHALRAHASGATGLAVDKFSGRILLSGGADGSIKLWDLESQSNANAVHTFTPSGYIPRAPRDSKGIGHSHGITYLAFYPFDSEAFLSSSYDKTLKLWSTRTAALSAEFDLTATIYSHSTSPIASHLLVACGTQHSNVRLVDLKSGSAVQALVAHGGPVLSTAWSPRHEHILASGHADGKVRIWDVRRASGLVAMLDQEDTEGTSGSDDHTQGQIGGRTYRPSAQAHDEAVNGLQWTDDGAYIVSAGLDRRVRVWDAASGANTLASFGSLVQNSHAETAKFFLSPTSLSEKERGLMFWANDHEILVFDLHEGSLISRLKTPGATNPLGSKGREAARSRITGLAWRGFGGEGRGIAPAMGGANCHGAIYSAHQDGIMRAWVPDLSGAQDDDAEGAGDAADEEQARNKKRKAIDDAYKSLMGKQVTFT